MYNCVDYTILGLRTTRKESTIRKRTLQGLMLSLLLHLLFLLIFVKNFKEITFLSLKSKQEKKISLNLKQIVTPVPKPIMTPPKPKPVPLTPRPVKQEPSKEVFPSAQEVKKKLLDKKKRLYAEKKESKENNVTKALQKKKIVKKKFIKKKRVAKRTKTRRVYKKQRRSKNPLTNALIGAGTSMYPTRQTSSSNSYVNKMIKQLYGGEFNTFTPTQKKFIKNNLGRIHNITQRTLTIKGYPDVAVKTRQQGTNIVTFYLHPNGDITGLRLKRRIGYAALDQNTLEVIRIAYKDYPYPKTKTKITFYVKYSMY